MCRVFRKRIFPKLPLLLLITATYLTFGGQAGAIAAVIDFQTLEHQSGIYEAGRVYREDGYTLIAGNGFVGYGFLSFGTDTRQYTGSTAVYTDGGEYTHLTRDDGKSFALVSIDLSKVDFTMATENTRFTGVRIDGTTISQTFNPTFRSDYDFVPTRFYFDGGFRDLVSAQWVTTYVGRAVQFDNITIDTIAAPIPGAIWLFLSGFVGLVSATFRIKR